MFLEIKFRGGIGNQLFQYATGRSLCISNKIPFLLLNIDSYEKESLKRTFSLAKLHIKGFIVTNNFVKKIFRKYTKLNKIFSALGLHRNIGEKRFFLQELKTQTGLFTSLDGFWQSPSYFNEIRGILLQEFTPVDLPSYPDWVHENDTVAIHIRRTDYLTENRYGFLGTGYYEDAVSVLKEKLVNPLFIIFSDDMHWCRDNFNHRNFVFFQSEQWEQDYLQLHLMSKCTHQIIANSSFSWWGAWLNSNPDKIVIRPEKPFIDNDLLYESHYPKEWIAINNRK